MNPVARQFDFEVQVLDGRFFLARKKAWQVLIAPWLAQENKEPAQAAGPEAAEWSEITRAIEDSLAKSAFNEFRVKAGRPPVEGFWINGGAFEEQLLPYTQIRCALTSDPTIRGIAEAAALRGPTLNLRRPLGLTALKATASASSTSLTIRLSKQIPPAGTPPGHAPLSAWSISRPRQKDLRNIIPAWSLPDGLRVSVIEKLQEQKSSFAFWKSPKNYTEAWLNSGR